MYSGWDVAGESKDEQEMKMSREEMMPRTMTRGRGMKVSGSRQLSRLLIVTKVIVKMIHLDQ